MLLLELIHLKCAIQVKLSFSLPLSPLPLLVFHIGTIAYSWAEGVKEGE